jgi:hypothetical protein
VSIDEFMRQSLHLPYGRWVTPDGTQVLYSRRYDLHYWPAGAERPEYCGPNWNAVGDFGDVRVKDGRFYSDSSACDIGISELHHALEALLNAWKRGDRATADVLAAWLLGKHRTYRDLIRSYRKELEDRLEE